MRHTVFFDLDGTLLPLETESFFRAYMTEIKRSGALDRIDKHKGEEVFGKAVYAMLGNNGMVHNKEVFFTAIAQMSGTLEHEIMPHFDRFYEDGFIKTKVHTRADRRVRQAVDTLKDKGYCLVLATNPVFPPVATNQRIAWAGLETDDFDYISYYDNSHYCKPNPQYYKEILGKIGTSADKCYIVGNDVTDDMSALSLGFEGFLVLDHVIGDPERIPQCKQGDYSALLGFAKSLPAV